MKKKIKSLTPEQIAKFPEYVDRWIKIGLATEAPGFDHTPAENAVRLAYKCAGLAEPAKFIWTESPLHSGLVYAALKSDKPDSVWASVWTPVRASMWDSVWDSVGAPVRAPVRASVWASVRDPSRDPVWASVRDPVRDPVWASVRDSVGASVGDSVWASVGASVRDPVRDSVWASVRDSVWDSVRASVWASVRDSVEGCHLAGIGSFYAFLQHELGCDCSKFDGLWACIKNCGWFVPFTDFVVISPRPYICKTRINPLGNHELHADGEPAVFYCDDFKIYANGGVRLPEKYGSVKVRDWQSKWLLEETNAELRMCLIKNIGYDKICHDLEAKKLDSWREYELLRIENADVEPIVLLKMTCPSTGKIHAGRVPPDTVSAREAATLRNHGIDPETFIVEH